MLAARKSSFGPYQDGLIGPHPGQSWSGCGPHAGQTQSSRGPHRVQNQSRSKMSLDSGSPPVDDSKAEIIGWDEVTVAEDEGS